MDLFSRITPDMLEKIACPLCSSSEVLRKSYRFDPFEVVACGRCPAWYLSPRLNRTAMELAYSEHYFEDGELGYSGYERQEKSLKLTFKWLLNMLVKQGVIRRAKLPSGEDRSLLEIGCAYGYLLELAQHHFDTVVGTEYSDAAADRARQVVEDAQVYVGGIGSVPTDKYFDLVICTQVIEHIYEPYQFIRDALGRLKPGGWLVMTTPNMNSWLRHLLGKRWPSFKIPEHVVYYDREGLCRLLEPYGLRSARPFVPREWFPLSLFFDKIGIRTHAGVLDIPVWVPGTTIGVMGQRDA